MNLDAFQWGRRAAHEPGFVREIIAGSKLPEVGLATTLEEIITKRAEFLAAYQNEAYGAVYKTRLQKLIEAERRVFATSTKLSETAARSLFKLMAIKDEYEVARLYSNGAFAAQLSETFSSYDRLEFHLAPPAFSRKNAKGHLVKQRFGHWMLWAFGMLAKLKTLRGTPLDVFGYSSERRMERGLIAEFESDLEFAVTHLNSQNHADIAALLALPMSIRGYGHVKHDNAEKAQLQRRHLLEKLENPLPAMALAAE
jgi:indolepyruvate ferredoxin oxidoreductase